MIDFLPPGCSEGKAVTSNTSAEGDVPSLTTFKTMPGLIANDHPAVAVLRRTYLHAQSQNITELTSGSLRHTSPSLLCLATSSADTDMAKCSEGAARNGRGRESSTMLDGFQNGNAELATTILTLLPRLRAALGLGFPHAIDVLAVRSRRFVSTRAPLLPARNSGNKHSNMLHQLYQPVRSLGWCEYTEDSIFS